MSLRLNRAVEAIAVATCEKAFPEEGCGLLIGPIPEDFDRPGRALEVNEARPLANGWDASAKTNRYLIDPKVLAKVEAELSGTGRGVVGFFHSHPQVPAWPSPFDLTMAMPCCSYWILQVRDGKAVDSRSWQRTEDGRSFVEEEIFLEG
ncbi:MAG: M67 family metallopeptidase [Elusimicrobia bacterium]|nr:M67 family metallopeptidase [Elusimicrobiota bacterium]